MAALDAAIAAEASQVADLQGGAGAWGGGAGAALSSARAPLQPQQPQQQQQQPPLHWDPLPAMRSLLRAVAPGAALGPGGEGWALLRGVLGACAPRGVLSGPELAQALAHWAPRAFGSAQEAWPYVVSLGVAQEQALDAGDFAVALEMAAGQM